MIPKLTTSEILPSQSLKMLLMKLNLTKTACAYLSTGIFVRRQNCLLTYLRTCATPTITYLLFV